MDREQVFDGNNQGEETCSPPPEFLVVRETGAEGESLAIYYAPAEEISVLSVPVELLRAQGQLNETEELGYWNEQGIRILTTPAQQAENSEANSEIASVSYQEATRRLGAFTLEHLPYGYGVAINHGPDIDAKVVKGIVESLATVIATATESDPAQVLRKLDLDPTPEYKPGGYL